MMEFFALTIWGLFVAVVVVMSLRAKSRPAARVDRGARWLMTGQYAAFFAILVRALLYPQEPFSPPLQIVGAGVATAGFLTYLSTLRVFAASYDPMVSIHRGHELCERGLFGLVRHPLYLSQMVTMIGTGLAMQHSAFLALPVPFAIMFMTARREERLLVEHVEGYAEYRERTGMFLPGPRPRPPSGRRAACE